MTQGIDNILLPKTEGLVFPYANNVSFGKYPKTKPLQPDSFEKRKPETTNEFGKDKFSSGKNVTSPFDRKSALYREEILKQTAPTELLNEYSKKENALKLLEKSPEAKYVLKKYGIKPQINTDNIKDIQKEHIGTTVDYSLRIADKLNLPSKDKTLIQQGAIFHDYGKITIPEELLNKRGKLTKEEKRIVDIHSYVGYAMLKNTPLERKALNIIRDHHKSLEKKPDFNTQIVTVADIYSALRTERSYKKTLSKEKALDIIEGHVIAGKIDPKIYVALEEIVKDEV